MSSRESSMGRSEGRGVGGRGQDSIDRHLHTDAVGNDLSGPFLPPDRHDTLVYD